MLSMECIAIWKNNRRFLFLSFSPPSPSLVASNYIVIYYTLLTVPHKQTTRVLSVNLRIFVRYSCDVKIFETKKLPYE